jgi:hypothetical protein
MLAATQRRWLTLGWLAAVLLAAQARAAEQCATCHTEPAQFSPFHDPARIGCVACHGGDPAATLQAQAHAALEAYPGRMATAARSCGQAACHADLVPRVENALMHTAAGVIALTRADLGGPAGDAHAAALGERGADSYLRKLCVGCHLGNERTHHGQSATDRGGGCSACHLQVALTPPGAQRPHPRLSLQVPDARCFGCHSRSSRIALNYVGLAETDAPPGSPQVAQLEDGRAVVQTTPDVHAVAGMGCVDCHTGAELMGDGTRPRRMREALDVQCADCHGGTLTEKPVARLTQPEWVAYALSPWRSPEVLRGRVPATARRGSALLHLWRNDGKRWLHAKAAGTDLPVPVMTGGLQHSLPGHGRLNCESCHAAWAPQCGGCHIGFDATQTQWDHVKRADTPGRWTESRWAVTHGPPALGVDSDNRIAPFVPGMNLILELPGHAPVQRVHYARVSPHTTQKAARGCASCHSAPAALGLIDGETQAPGNPAWRLPRGWVQAGHAAAPGLRPGERSFSPAEVRRIQRVGSCLPCHDGSQTWYRDFAAALTAAASVRGHPPLPGGRRP